MLHIIAMATMQVSYWIKSSCPIFSFWQLIILISQLSADFFQLPSWSSTRVRGIGLLDPVLKSHQGGLQEGTTEFFTMQGAYFTQLEPIANSSCIAAAPTLPIQLAYAYPLYW